MNWLINSMFLSNQLWKNMDLLLYKTLQLFQIKDLWGEKCLNINDEPREPVYGEQIIQLVLYQSYSYTWEENQNMMGNKVPQRHWVLSKLFKPIDHESVT